MAGTGAMQLAKISKTKFGDKSGASGASSASPNSNAVSSVIAPVQYTQDVQGASIEGAIQDSKVYVVESDITDTQDRVAVTESEARY
jgi:aerobic-type carbon monoxide dehydrogenase small subunit (CoxS/CutS family)